MAININYSLLIAVFYYTFPLSVIKLNPLSRNNTNEENVGAEIYFLYILHYKNNTVYKKTRRGGGRRIYDDRL